MRSTVTISFPMPSKSRRSPATSSPRADSAVAIRDERISLTELHDLQQKASRLERIAKALLKTPEQAFYVFDYQRQEFIFGEEQVCALYGYKPADIQKVSGGWFGIVHPDDVEEFRRMHDRLMQSSKNEVFDMRMRVLRKNGGFEWVHVHQRVLERSGSGGTVMEVGMVRVITAQVNAEQALQTSQVVLHGLFQRNTAGVVVFDHALRIVDANPMICRMLGYDRKAMLRMGVLDVLAPGSRAPLEKLFSALRSGKKPPATFETRLENRDGSVMDVLAAVSCEDGKKAPCGQHMLIFTDVTSLKQAENALQRELEMNRVLLDHAPVAIGLFHPDGTIRRMNKAAERLFGFKSKEVLGHSIWEVPILTKEDTTASMKRFQKLLQGEEHVSAVIPVTTKAGEPRQVATESRAVRSPGKGVEFVVSMGIDVTERQRLEAEVIRVAEQEHIRIGADLHDGVGQTLTGVVSLTEVLTHSLSGSALAEASRILELLKTAQEEVRRLSHGLSPAAVKNRGLVGGLRLIAETIRMNFRRECDCQLDEKVVLADSEAETHLFRIAQEAVNNALRHGGAQKVRLVLRRQDRTTCVLEVSDDGSGFTPPSGEEGEKGGNGGIGIRVMEYRANLIGGQLKLTARPGHGVRVSCTFPTSLLKNGNLTKP